MGIIALKGLGKAFTKKAKKVQKKVDKFAEKEIKKMNSKKVFDQVSAWSKPGIPTPEVNNEVEPVSAEQPDV